MKAITKNSVTEIVVQCCIDNIENVSLLKSRDIFFKCFQGNLSSFEA